MKNDNGQTPLSLAAQGGHSLVVDQFFQRNDVDMNSKDNNGRTPLSHAAAAGDVETVDLLLKRRRIRRDLKDNNGRTPLSWAACDDVVALFVLHYDLDCLDKGSKDNNTQATLDWARNQGSNASTLFSEWPDIESDYKEYYWIYREASNCLRKARKKANFRKRLERGKNVVSTRGQLVHR